MQKLNSNFLLFTIENEADRIEYLNRDAIEALNELFKEFDANGDQKLWPMEFK